MTSYNPVYLVFHEWRDIVQDLRKANSLKEVWKILFDKPGAEIIKNREQQKASPKKEVLFREEKNPEAMVMEK